MKVRLQPADKGGCGFYRMRWPAKALADQGYDVHQAETWPQALCERSALGVLVRHVDVDCDVLVFQRPMEGRLMDSWPALRKQGVAIVVEIDDDFHALPKGHPARTDTINRDGLNRQWLKRMCAEADLVTCTTEALARRYAPHGRYIIVPNFVPERYLSIERKPHDGVRVGWTGSIMTHIDDLRVCGTGVRDALRATGATFHCVGTGVGVREQLQLDAEPTTTGWVDIDRYPHEYAQLDVALVPLQPNLFNEAKSYLKGLEAAALGVPFIASPTGPYRELLTNIGTHAETPAEWWEEIRYLYSDVGETEDQAQRGREYAKTQTIEGNAWRWMEAWEQAVLNARGRRAA